MASPVARRDRIAPPLQIVQQPRAVAYPQGQPLEVYRTQDPWRMWGPVLVLALIASLTLLAVVHLWNTGAISLAELDLATEQARLEHARLIGADEGWSDGKVTALVAAIILGVIAITCARR